MAPMTRQAPYQPLPFRLLHGVTALLVIGSLISGFLVYDSWDRRFGHLGFTRANRDLIDIHGTFGFLLFFIFIGFAIYSLTVGQRRLVQPKSIQAIASVGTPAWWYFLQRLTNTTMLLAALVAVASGKFQDENWLPNGEMNHTWYYAHLIAWVLVLVAFAIHLLMSAKVGGIPLLLSVWSVKYRPDDSPSHWYRTIISRFRRSDR